LSKEENESEASNVDNVVFHSGSTILSQSKPKEITVQSNGGINITKRDYKSVNGVENTFTLTKQKILEDFDNCEIKKLIDDPPPTETAVPAQRGDTTLTNDNSNPTGPSPEIDVWVKRFEQTITECSNISAEIKDLLSKLLKSNLAAFYKEEDVLPISIAEEHYIPH
jgi:hypothetical protein